MGGRMSFIKGLQLRKCGLRRLEHSWYSVAKISNKSKSPTKYVFLRQGLIFRKTFDLKPTDLKLNKHGFQNLESSWCRGLNMRELLNITGLQIQFSIVFQWFRVQFKWESNNIHIGDRTISILNHIEYFPIFCKFIKDWNLGQTSMRNSN